MLFISVTWFEPLNCVDFTNATETLSWFVPLICVNLANTTESGTWTSMRHWGSIHHTYLRWLIIQSREQRLLVNASWYHSTQHVRTTKSSMCRKLQAICMIKSWTGGWLGGHVNHMAHMNWRFEFIFSDLLMHQHNPHHDPPFCMILWCTNMSYRLCHIPITSFVHVRVMRY